jgi:hypothetical protein
MQKGIEDNLSSHPSDEELANFIDKNLDEEKEIYIVKHLISCDECSDVVALVMQYGDKVDNEVSKSINPIATIPIKIVNTINYKGGIGIVLGGLIASLMLFINLPNGGVTELGMIDLSKPPTIEYRGSKNIMLLDEIIDADKILYTLVNSIDFSKNKIFQRAEEREKKGEINEAKSLYKQAFIKALEESNSQKRLQNKIVIHSKIFHLSKDKELQEYRDILRYEIRLYILTFMKKE